MKTRIITGLALLFVAVPLLIVGGVFFNLFLLFVSVLVGHEIVLLFNYRWSKGVRYSVTVFPALALIILNYHLVSLVEVILIWMLILIVINIIDYRFDLDDLAMLFYIYVIILTAFYQVMMLRSMSEGLALVSFVAAVSYGTDTFAYFSGYFFGKHKLNERISPKKTIEGSIGGTLMGTIIGTLVLVVFTNSYSLLSIVLMSFALSIAGQFGDLAFSSIKRHYRIKDFSNLLPGHGGIIDRVDSLMINLVVMMILMPYLFGVIV